MQNTYDFFNGIYFKNSIENCEFHDNHLNSVLSIQNSENLKIISSNFSNNYMRDGVILLIQSFLNTIFEIAFCIFKTNDSGGSALYLHQLGNLSIIKCEFLNNSAIYSGAMQCNDAQSIIIADSLFFENKSPNEADGGAINLDCLLGNVSLIIVRSNFSKNVATNAGAIRLNSWSMFSFFKITDCFFAENNSTKTGGALLINLNGDFLIKGNFFSNNFANSGAAIYFANAGPSLYIYL